MGLSFPPLGHIIAIQHGIGNIPDDDPDHIIARTWDGNHSR
jgi:hypothetical protein